MACCLVTLDFGLWAIDKSEGVLPPVHTAGESEALQQEFALAQAVHCPQGPRAHGEVVI